MTLLLGLVAAVLIVSGCVLAATPPRITLLNAALRIDYPWRAGAGALVAAAGAGLAAALVRRRWAQALCGLLAFAATGVGLSLLTYRLETTPEALESESVFSRTVVPWRDVTRVDAGPAMVVVWGAGETQIRVDTADFRPEQRATLDRSIARLVHQAGARPEVRR